MKTHHKILFGQDSTDLLAGEMKRYGQNVLLVYGGGSIKRTGLYDRVLRQLTDKKLFELPGVEPNPRLTTVHEGIRICRENHVEFILAVGGGSTIDCAKAISIVYHMKAKFGFLQREGLPKICCTVGSNSDSGGHRHRNEWQRRDHQLGNS
jgi:alcohol dehydrogenase YqhD (iron-dependent ADH family)